MPQGSRPSRVGDQIRSELASLLRREVHDPGIGFLTITSVKVSPDLQQARVYYTLMGDSNAQMWIPTFRGIANRESWTLAFATFPACPWPRDLQYAHSFNTKLWTICADEQRDWYDRVIPTFKPDIIFVANGTLDDPTGINRYRGASGNLLDTKTPAGVDGVKRLIAQSLQALKSPGRTVVVIEPTPRPAPDFDPLQCLSEGKAAEDCGYTAIHGPTAIELETRRLETPQLFSLDLDRVVCRSYPECDAVTDNIIVKRDATHITATYARHVVAAVDGILHRKGILKGG